MSLYPIAPYITTTQIWFRLRQGTCFPCSVACPNGPMAMPAMPKAEDVIGATSHGPWGSDPTSVILVWILGFQPEGLQRVYKPPIPQIIFSLFIPRRTTNRYLTIQHYNHLNIKAPIQCLANALSVFPTRSSLV